jgi:hypothetical protein
VAIRNANGWHLQDPPIRTELDLHGAWMDPDGGMWGVGGDLTTSLDQGMVVYGGDASVGSTVVDAQPSLTLATRRRR